MACQRVPTVHDQTLPNNAQRGNGNMGNASLMHSTQQIKGLFHCMTLHSVVAVIVSTPIYCM
jgi:hypothetical protein